MPPKTYRLSPYQCSVLHFTSLYQMMILQWSQSICPVIHWHLLFGRRIVYMRKTPSVHVCMLLNGMCAANKVFCTHMYMYVGWLCMNHLLLCICWVVCVVFVLNNNEQALCTRVLQLLLADSVHVSCLSCLVQCSVLLNVVYFLCNL